jgi:hypothetical protein
MVHGASIVLASCACLLAGCVSFPTSQYCSLSADQVATLKTALRPAIESISDPDITYEPMILEGRYIFRSNGVCWCSLFPRSVDPRNSVLDGDYTIDVDTATMKVSNLREVVY